VSNKNILLIEPGYRNKYPPLGLMKIAQYHGPNGKRDNVRFIKGENKSVLGEAWDRIYIWIRSMAAPAALDRRAWFLRLGLGLGLSQRFPLPATLP